MSDQETVTMRPPTEDELLLDLYHYRKEYEVAITDELKEMFKDRIDEAEKLYKTISN